VSTRTFSPKQSQVHILPRIFLTRCGRQRRGQRRRSSHDSALALSGGGLTMTALTRRLYSPLRSWLGGLPKVVYNGIVL
jgi:hypothetical protein